MKWVEATYLNAVQQIGWVGILAGLVAVLYLGSTRIEALFIAAMVAAIGLSIEPEASAMNPADWSILLIVAYEVPSLFFSQYRANSIHTADAITIAVMVYCTVRMTIRTGWQAAYFSGTLALGGSWIGVSGMRQFSSSARTLGELGFVNLVAFRSRLIFPPSPWVVGEWFTLLLLILPFACAVSVYLWQRQLRWPAALSTIAPFSISATLLLSLSRAVFWSTLIFFFVVCALLILTQVITIRAGGVLLGSSLFTLALILVCEAAVYPGIFRAYEGQQMSQVRSTEGRIAVWHQSMSLIRDHPLWGIGSSNAALALTSTADLEETVGFASGTFSLPLQVLLEKGFIGLLIYATFPAFVARQFILTMQAPAQIPGVPRLYDLRHTAYRYSNRPRLNDRGDRSARKAMICCFAAGLVAVFCRELVYSSVLGHTLTLVLVAVLSALICS